MRRVVVTLLLQFGATEQVELGSEAPAAVLAGMLRGSCWALSCSDHLYAVKLKHAKGLLVNGKATRKLFRVFSSGMCESWIQKSLQPQPPTTFLRVSSTLLLRRKSHAGLLWQGRCEEQGPPYVIVVVCMQLWLLGMFLTLLILHCGAILDGIWFAFQCGSQTQMRNLMWVGTTAHVLCLSLPLQRGGSAW